ncbi:MAG: SGNH/GDSL hydrolase family protein, partial [Nitrospinota bacterium]
FFSGYSIHAHPAFLSVVFGVVAAVAALSGPRWRWRVLLEWLALMSAATILALAMVEVALRVWDPPMSRGRVRSYARFSPEFGWLNRAGAEGWHVDIGYHIRINRHGHRGPDYPVKKSPGVFRILGLGDSLTFGWGVEEDQTFLNVMKERLLKEGYRVEVLNAAVPAWHSVQSLHYLLKEGIRFQPDLVVMNFFVDEVFYTTIESLLKGEIAQRMRDEEAEIARDKGGMARKLRLYNVWFNYRRIRRASRELIRRNPYPDFESERKALRRGFDKNPELVAGVEKVVSQWVAVRKKLGIPIIFSFIPAGGALNAPDYQGDRRVLRRASLASGFPFLDVVPLFEKQPNPRKLYLHPRDGHVSAAGHALIGEALAQMVLKGGWLKK